MRFAAVILCAALAATAWTQTTSAPASAAGKSPAAWSMFRGEPAQRGVAAPSLTEKLEVRWKFAAGQGIASTAAIVAGKVYVGGDDGVVHALDLKSGRLLWKYESGDTIESSPTVHGDALFFGNDSGNMHCLSLADGTLRWKAQTDGRIISSVNVYRDRLLFGSYDGNLYCLQPGDGGLIWKFETVDRIHATPAVSAGLTVVAGCDAKLHILDVETGKQAGVVDMGAVSGSSPAIDMPLAYLGTYGNEVLAVNVKTAQTAWRFQEPEQEFPFMSSPAVAGGLVVIGGRDKQVHALDAESGAERWRSATQGRIDGSPVVVGARVFIGSGDGNLYELDLRTGKQKWRFEAGEPFAASPAIAEDCLVIGTLGGTLYCFGAK